MDQGTFTKPSGTLLPLEEYPGSYCFVPNLLPEDITVDREAISLLGEASMELGKIESYISQLPGKLVSRLIALSQKNEAVYSSRIEGTKSTLSDVLMEELSIASAEKHDDAHEVLNNFRAISRGAELIGHSDIDMQMLLSLHAILMQGVRGGSVKLEPGQLRHMQNWIVPYPLKSINDATYIPPRPSLVREHLDNALEYMKNGKDAALIRIGIMHYKFEAIHPFADGNGRIGRLLIILYLIKLDLLGSPAMDISAYIERNKSEYYSLLLRASTESEYLPWLKFFFRCIAISAKASRMRIEALLKYRSDTLKELEKRHTGKSIAAFEKLFETPITSTPEVKRYLNVSNVTASNVIKRLVAAGVLERFGSGERPKSYACSKILEILSA